MMRARKIDYYISADVLEAMKMLPFSALLDLFRELNHRPFRGRPAYIEGVWGGYYVHRLRDLPTGTCRICKTVVWRKVDDIKIFLREFKFIRKNGKISYKADRTNDFGEKLDFPSYVLVLKNGKEIDFYEFDEIGNYKNKIIDFLKGKEIEIEK